MLLYNRGKHQKSSTGLWKKVVASSTAAFVTILTMFGAAVPSYASKTSNAWDGDYGINLTIPHWTAPEININVWFGYSLKPVTGDQRWYCIEIDVPRYTELVTNLTSSSDEASLKANYLITKYGYVNDNQVQAALAYVIHDLLDTTTSWVNTKGNLLTYLDNPTYGGIAGTSTLVSTYTAEAAALRDTDLRTASFTGVNNFSFKTLTGSFNYTSAVLDSDRVTPVNRDLTLTLTGPAVWDNNGSSTITVSSLTGGSATYSLTSGYTPDNYKEGDVVVTVTASLKNPGESLTINDGTTTKPGLPYTQSMATNTKPSTYVITTEVIAPAAAKAAPQPQPKPQPEPQPKPQPKPHPEPTQPAPPTASNPGNNGPEHQPSPQPTRPSPQQTAHQSPTIPAPNTHTEGTAPAPNNGINNIAEDNTITTEEGDSAALEVATSPTTAISPLLIALSAALTVGLIVGLVGGRPTVKRASYKHK